MRLFSFGFLLWVFALATAVQAETKIWAFSCIYEGDSNSVDIFVQKDGKIKLLGSNVGDGTVKEVQPNVFEFRNSDPLFVGYLRKIKGKWKYNISNAGIFSTLDCINLSQELNDVVAYYASLSFGKLGNNEIAPTLLGAHKLVGSLRKEINQLQEEKKKLEASAQTMDAEIKALRALPDELSDQLALAVSRAEIAEQSRNILRRQMISKDAILKFESEVFGQLRKTFAEQESVKIVDNKIVMSKNFFLEYDRVTYDGMDTIKKLAPTLLEAIANFQTKTKTDWVLLITLRDDHDGISYETPKGLRALAEAFRDETDFMPRQIAFSTGKKDVRWLGGSPTRRSGEPPIELTLVERYKLDQ